MSNAGANPADLTTLMGWEFGDNGYETLRLELRQGPFLQKLVRKVGCAAARFYGSDGRPLAILGYDQKGVWACKPDAEPLALDSDLLAEFALTTRLFSNDFSSLPYEPHVTDLEAAHVRGYTFAMPEQGGMDVFVWDNGHLAGALLRVGRRAVRLLPAGRRELSPGRSIYSRWLRDEEAPIDLVDVRCGTRVLDAEVRRIAG